MSAVCATTGMGLAAIMAAIESGKRTPKRKTIKAPSGKTYVMTED